MKKKTRRKLSKQLNKLIKLHGAEMALALVTGIVSALAADRKTKADKKQKSKSGTAKGEKVLGIVLLELRRRDAQVKGRLGESRNRE